MNDDERKAITARLAKLQRMLAILEAMREHIAAIRKGLIQ
jgi:hypothetical protein